MNAVTTDVDAREEMCLSLESWASRDIEPKDFLLGEVFSTTTRAMLSADTGLGKTHFAFALAFAMAAGQDFCHWRYPGRVGINPHGEQYERPPPRVLILDGEMSAELVKERLSEAERRIGAQPEGLFCLCKEDVPNLDPLNTESGQSYLADLIGDVDPDFVILDNLASLTIGSLQDEEAWKPIVPLMFGLTAQRIGQLWVTHTGHDRTRDYGLKMKSWHMDTCMVATRIEDNPADIAFRLEFTKARQRKPSNRQDYETVDVVLEQDQWSAAVAKKAKKRPTGLGSNQKIVLASAKATVRENGTPSPGFTGMPSGGQVCTVEQLERLAFTKLAQNEPKRKKEAFDRALESLVADEWLGRHNDYLWTIE